MIAIFWIAVIFLSGRVDGVRGTYEGYELLEVVPRTADEVKLVAKLAALEPKLEFWSDARKVGNAAKIFVPPEITQKIRNVLSKNGLNVKVLSNNYQREVESHLAEIAKSRSDLTTTNYDYNTYHTFDEIMKEVVAMPDRCPTGYKCEVYSIGQSYQGKEQQMLRVYKDEPNRSVYWVDAMIHAREWLAGAVHQKIVNHMLTNYDTDENVRKFLDLGDWHFLFVHNPDGYAYSWTTGQRLWRKSRSNNTLTHPDTDCQGVDLNRNYMHRWSNSGTSPNPCSNTYPGISPSSEIEVKNVQAEILRLGSRLKALVSLHTAAKMVLTPWGGVLDPGTEAICEVLPEQLRNKVQTVANAMGWAIEDTHGYHEWRKGTFCDVLYPSGGTTQDFVTATTGVIYSFTPELRDENADGNTYIFLAPASEIQPAFEETWNGFVAMVDTIELMENEEDDSSGSASPHQTSLVYFTLLLIVGNVMRAS